MFTIERIKKILCDLNYVKYTNSLQIDSVKYKPCDYECYYLINEPSDDWEDYTSDMHWGGNDQHCWFKTQLTMPAEFSGQKIVFTAETGTSGWDATNPQFLVFINGNISHGFDVNHKQLLLTDCAVAGETFAIDLYAHSGMNEGYTVLKLSVSQLETEVEKLYFNIKVPLDTCELLDKEDIRRITMLNHLNNAVNLLDMRDVSSEFFHQSVAIANDYLEKELYDTLCGNEYVTEVCVGHTHIDVAWLWTLTQTREKAVRSFATVLNLMKIYPDYIFMSSQPQLYEFVKQDRPDLYEEIKKMIKSGRWEVEGAMWVEADCNLTSGESLVRQIMFGKRFFMDEFGVDNKILWLPDVFGYSAALPQILQKSGVKYFMTTKISWNDTNKLPYDTLKWRGLDGTEVLTHFVTTQDYNKDNNSTGTTYSGKTSPTQIKGCWQRYQQKDINTEVLNCFGFGDGGGGPTYEMLEQLKRTNRGIPGCPKTETGTALSFFEKLQKQVIENKKLPTWSGELYLEYHRGTYTTMARNKKYNRKCEFMNQDAELFSSLSKLLCKTQYPQTQINSCWKTVLLNQFHDIIPGSSIKKVYEESKQQYETIIKNGGQLITNSLNALVKAIDIKTKSIIVFNTSGFERNDMVSVKMPENQGCSQVFDNGQPLVTQLMENDTLTFFAKNIPSKGYKVFQLRKSENQLAPQQMQISEEQMENDFFKIKINSNGTLASIFDKTNNREVLQNGSRGNQLQAFEDIPFEYDAWNIESYYQEKMWDVHDSASIEVAEQGLLRIGLKLCYAFMNSTISQTIYLYRDIPRIDFDTEIDWKDSHTLLKAAFPVDIHSDKATYEIQYGNVDRPTHSNTSWDQARFEVCGHKWVDMSEGSYGVSLLNDCKYGYDIHDSVMRLTLLKSSTSPNPDADKEKHHFIYSLYPHANDWKQSQVSETAFALNCPLYALYSDPHAGNISGEFSFIQTDSDNIIIDVVKKAEDSEDIIIRFYEYKNKRSSVKFKFGLPLTSAEECDLLENSLGSVQFSCDALEVSVKPYEIKTYKLRF